MKVFLTGATGFIGRALVLRLRRDGHTVLAWVRNPHRARLLLGQEAECVPLDIDDDALAQALGTCDAVVNLAGESVAGGRWTDARKKALYDSRVALTQRLVAAIRRAPKAPGVFISTSGSGYYGDTKDAPQSELSQSGNDFLAQLCIAWESAARAAESPHTRLLIARFGVVLGREGGALGQLLPIFKAGLGGRVGSGAQYMPWIHLHDLVEVLALACTDKRYDGVVNCVAPQVVTNATFAQTLGKVLQRPAAVPVPAWALRVGLGEAGDFLLFSQNVTSRLGPELGYKFQYPTLQAALAQIVQCSGVTIEALRDDAQPVDTPASTYLRRHPPKYLLRAEADLPRSRNEVFDFFSRAENLGLLTPAAMALQASHDVPTSMEVGTEIGYTLRIGPVPMRWLSRIEAWANNRLFVDAQERGPYACWWHEHHFDTQQAGTRMEDRVFYAPPLGPIGRVAQHAFVAPTLRRIFAYRNEAMHLRFGNTL